MSVGIADRVVVTGASSGIGRRTAAAFAAQGAQVALAARDRTSLEEAARECDQAGGRAVVVPTDVTDEDAVQALARRAADAFGGIDVWVNAAAVIAYGTFEDVPPDAYRRVIEVNLFGQIHGARAVLPYFRRQEHGVLVNMGSVWAAVTSPYVSSYVVSKFAVRAFSECLQEGLRLERGTADIHVCTILPQSVDTPIFDHAGNWSGRRIRPVPPVIDPDRVVRAVIETARHPRRQRTVGGFGRLLEVAYALLPGAYRRLVPAVMAVGAFSRAPATDNSGNLLSPMPAVNAADSHWRTDHRRLAVAAAVTVGVVTVTVAAARSARRLTARG